MAYAASAATYYVSPSATVGDGSLGDPWSIYLGLTTNAVTAGDTVYLRGGTYAGRGFFCSFSGTVASPITVQAYPGETVTLTDGLIGTLYADMSTATNALGRSTNVIRNSENFYSGMPLGVGSENMRLDSITDSPTNWLVIRAFGTPISTHTAGDPVFPFEVYILDHTGGSNVVFRDLEITSPMSTNRVWTTATNFSSGINIKVGDKVINCVIHDVAQPGIGAFVHVPGGFEINGTIIWGVGMFDTTGGFNEYRGAGIYSQNEGGGGVLATIKDTLAFRQTTDGLEMFAATGPVRDFQFVNCYSAANGRSSLDMYSQDQSTSNTFMNGCVVSGLFRVTYSSVGNTKNYVVNNVAVNTGIAMLETTNSVVTNNYILMAKGSGDAVTPVQYTSALYSSNNLNITWDYNTYVIGDGATSKQFTFVSSEGQPIGANGSGNLAFAGDNNHGWNFVTPFDRHSTCVTNWPNNYLLVKSTPLDYNTNRHHVAVVSTSGATSAALDLSTNGFNVGDRYTLRDAQNYFTVIQSGTYGGGTISLPLNLTAIAALQGSVTNFTPTHTDLTADAGFNVFVLDRLSPASAVLGSAVVGRGSF